MAAPSQIGPLFFAPKSVEYPEYNVEEGAGKRFTPISLPRILYNNQNLGKTWDPNSTKIPTQPRHMF